MRLTATTPRLTHDGKRYCLCDGGHKWICRDKLCDLVRIHGTTNTYLAVCKAKSIWITISNRPNAHAVKCRIETIWYQLSVGGNQCYILCELDVFIRNSLYLPDGGTFYISLDYDDGKGGGE